MNSESSHNLIDCGTAPVRPNYCAFIVHSERTANDRRMNRRKGSTSLDFVFASLLFILMLGFTVVAYSSYSDVYQINEGKRTLESSTLSISELLVKSKGYPEDWENNVSSLEVLGLADSENVLGREKVNAFGSISYNHTKDLFGIGNEFFITIESLDGKRMFSKGAENANASSVSIERIVYFNRSASRLMVRIYG